MHIEDYTRHISLRLMEAKSEQRAQHASSITSLKEITAAIKSLDQAIRLGTEQSQSTTGGTPAAPGVGTTMSAPPPPKAAPAAPATPATPAADGAGIPPAPGYASSAAASAAMFPPSAPVFSAPPPAAYQPPVNRAGRLRVSNRDGTLVARAVSPHGRPQSAVTSEWASEYGLGTVNFNGSIFRISPDSYI